MKGSCRLGWEMVVGVALILEPHNSVCLGFCPVLSRVESPGVRWVRMQEAWRDVILDFS